MSASVGLTVMVYGRNRALWLRDYLVYAAGYGVWILFAGWVFFQQEFLSGPVPELTLLFAWARAGVSIVIAYFGPLFFLRAAGVKNDVRLVLIVGTAAAILATTIVMVLVFNLPRLSRATSIVFNFAFAAIAWYAFVAVRRGKANRARPMAPVMLISGVSYTILALLTSAGRFLIPPAAAIYANVLAGGVFVLLWAVTAMAVCARWIGGGRNDDEVPEAFVIDYQITPREAELLAVLAQGKTAVQIGETLFISQRTVEAHLYNVYRKCGVKNRVELLGKIGSYRG